ncbi:hypothetical protein BGZ83_001609 [Gryganskiella cystojenkinii]|nr:hypothetical protein BGZ83_001609 [Gryganskiella cystojenkinii]
MSDTITSSSTLDIQSILASETAQLDASMSNEQILEHSRRLNESLTAADQHLTHLVLSETFKDHQESLKHFLGSPACEHLESLEYKSAGTSIAKILLSPSSTNSTSLLSDADPIDQIKEKSQTPVLQIKDITEELVHRHVPWSKSMKVLKLGYNAEAPQAPEDVAILSVLLRYMPRLEEFYLGQPLDDLVLFEGLAGSDLSKLKKVTVTFNNECGMDQEEIETKIRESLALPSPHLGELNVDLDDRESNFYLNLSRDRHFQAFLRRFTGDRNQQ